MGSIINMMIMMMIPMMMMMMMMSFSGRKFSKCGGKGERSSPFAEMHVPLM